MSTAYLVLLILAILYVPLWVWAWRRPEQAARFHLQKYGPAIMLKTQLGISTMDKLAPYHRFWRVFGFVSKVISAVLFFLMMYMVVVALLALPSRVGSGGIGIEYALAIPGFNPILPLSYGIIALFFAMVVHEMGHGIQTRTNGCKVDSTGLLHIVVPMGAFVDPNEEEMSRQPRRVRMDMYTAGISVNTFAAIACMALIILSSGSISSPYDDEAGVYSVDMDSPAYFAGVPASAIIDHIEKDGVRYGYVPVGDGTSVSLEWRDGSGQRVALDPKDSFTIHYTTDEGEKTGGGFHVGVFVKKVTDNSPASDAGLEPGCMLYSLKAEGGQEVMLSSYKEFKDFMDGTRGGQTISVKTMRVSEEGDSELSLPKEVVLSERNGIGFLGVTVNNSGMALTTPEILLDMATHPFYFADGSPMSYVQSLFSYMSGPFNGLDPISDEVRWWYDVPLGDAFWIFISLLYWLFWLDLLLAISNALPAYPFDGGFIFAGGVDWVLEKFGVKDEERRGKLSDSISNSASTVTLFMFALVILSFVI